MLLLDGKILIFVVLGEASHVCIFTNRLLPRIYLQIAQMKPKMQCAYMEMMEAQRSLALEIKSTLRSLFSEWKWKWLTINPTNI